MAITKKIQNHNNMLLMLASLACGQNDSRSGSSTNHRQRDMPMPAVSDTSDDDTIVRGPAKSEIVVARRRRRPIKKRIPMVDHRPSLLSSSVSVPRKSLLESSILCITPKANWLAPSQVAENRAEKVFALKEISSSSVPARAQEIEDDTSMENNVNETDDNVPVVPVLVCDDGALKHNHSPLVLPSYLPCPASALRYVQSISLTLEER